MMSWVLPDTGLIEDFFFEIPITDEMKIKIKGGSIYKMGAARTAHSDTVIKEINSGGQSGQDKGLDCHRRAAACPSGQYQLCGQSL
jgi:hypothetical protein